MGGLGMALAGALAGAGQGMAEQGKMDFEAKRQLALENLRSQNQQTEAATTARFNDANEASKQARAYTYDVNRDNNKSANDVARDAATHGFEAGQKALDRVAAVDLTKLKSTLDVYSQTYGTTFSKVLEDGLKKGDIKDVKQDDHGNFFGIRPDGSTMDLNVVGTPTSQTGLAGLGLNLGGGAPAAGGKTKSAANPGLHTTKPAAAAAPAVNMGTPNQPAAWIQDPAEALRFVRDPSNKGKYFVGPDGQNHQVK